MTVGKPMHAKKPKSRRWLWITGFLILIGVGIFFLLRHLGNAPATGAIIDSDLSSQKSNEPVLTTKVLDTPFYTLNYSSEYELQVGLQKGAKQEDLQVLTKRSARGSPGSIRASLGIEPLPAGGVTEMSSYSLARAYPSSYKLETKQLTSGPATVITKTDDNSAKILLIPHAGKVLVMALSSQSSGDAPDYDKFLDQATSTLAWK